jgi:hypothetical protein
MKNTVLLVVVVIFIFLLSCKKKEEIKFPNEKRLSFVEMNVGDKLGSVVSIKTMTDYLIICERNADTQLQLINKKTKESYFFGKVGEGPGRVLNSFSIIPEDNKIGVYDATKFCLFSYCVDSILRYDKLCEPEVVIKKFPSLLLDLAQLDDQIYATCGLYGMDRFALINKEGDVIYQGGKLPDKKNEQITDIVHAVAYQGMLTSNKKMDKVAICTRYAGMLQIYSYENGALNMISDHTLFLADYSQEGENFAPNAQTRWGYLSIDANEKYIYALYTGANQSENPETIFLGDEIHVYDWNGNPVQLIKADRKLSRICVDENRIYGFDNEKEDIVFASL